MASTTEGSGRAAMALDSRSAAEAWFDALLDSSPIAIGVISAVENRLVRANAALLELYGRTREELFSTDPFSMAVQVTHPDDLVAEQKLFAELAVGARRWYRMEKRYVRPDGTIRWGLATLCGGFSPALDPRLAVGPLSWLMIQVVDVTELRAMAELAERRDEELRHAQRIDALGRLAAGIAHDFNNLLTVITGHAEVLKDLTRDPAAQLSVAELGEDLDAILAAAERASALTAQLLTHGRREPASPRAFVLSELASALHRLLLRTLGTNVEVESSLDAMGTIFADQGQVGQVLMNLMLNARDAIDERGRIRLETRDVVVEQGEVVGGLARGEWVALVVSDDGHGMSPEVQARMFEPFFTTRADRPGVQGSGLGLATVQRIVAEARGHIDVQSAPGRGTTVSVFFPRSELPVSVAPAAPPPISLRAPNTRRILIVEDDPYVRSLVGTVLLGAHYLVVVTRDGAEALQRLETDPEPFHLIVTDLLMPRLGGVPLAQQLRERGIERKILFISGYSSQTPAELLPFGYFLPKPFTPAQLLAAVERALGDAKEP